MTKEWMALTGLVLFVGLGGLAGCLSDNSPSAPQGGQFSSGPPPATATFTSTLTPTVTNTVTPTITFLGTSPTATPTPTP